LSGLRGERVVLEPVRPEHAERLRELRSSLEVARWWDSPPEGWPLEVDPEDHYFTIMAGDEIVGYLQFWEDPDPSGRHADVDIFLGAGGQERGLGTETMRLIIRHLIEDRGHHRITLSTAVENERAIHVYEKVGFRRVGVTRKSSLNEATGEWGDEFLMEYVV
jgi:aminoglycoside 6'-N-acetyltransferase